jgi:transposase-like protein
MSERGRRRFSPQRKADLLKRHLLEKKDVSEVCAEADLQPSQLYRSSFGKGQVGASRRAAVSVLQGFAFRALVTAEVVDTAPVEGC